MTTAVEKVATKSTPRARHFPPLRAFPGPLARIDRCSCDPCPCLDWQNILKQGQRGTALPALISSLLGRTRRDRPESDHQSIHNKSQMLDSFLRSGFSRATQSQAVLDSKEKGTLSVDSSNQDLYSSSTLAPSQRERPHAQP